MKTPSEVVEQLKKKIDRRHVNAFLWTFFVGLLIHLPVMVADYPNHDGLASLYFDQNMITSGRWFLTVACGFSSYYSVPWVIGLLGLLFLGLASVVLTELLELKSSVSAALCGGMLSAFPALASTFAYVFTLDGYMLALLLATLSVLLTKKSKWGFLPGALCLAFSLGTYQAYLPFAILLCLWQVTMLFVKGEWTRDRKALLAKTGNYLEMGLLGFGLYYLILRVLLLIQGKQLDTYQGIGEAQAGGEEGILATIKAVYVDFWSFSVKGHVLFQNVFSAIALAVLVLLAVYVVIRLANQRKWWKQPGFYAILVLLFVVIPPCNSCIRIVSSKLTYHLLMRYQWVLYPIFAVAFCDGYVEAEGKKERSLGLMQWLLLGSTVTLIFCHGLADNVGYSNLQKKYERTYAYCLRLLDRIEQTEGYYQGIPVALVGVVGEDEFPRTDLTGEVTGNMIGLSGERLLYTGENYETFIKNYLGATLNIVDGSIMDEIYYKDEYVRMDSFPGPGSTKVIDGILCVKTENSRRD